MKHKIIKNAPNCEVFHQNIALRTEQSSKKEEIIYNTQKADM